MIWTAGFRTAVISPYEQIQLTEPRGFADLKILAATVGPSRAPSTPGSVLPRTSPPDAR